MGGVAAVCVVALITILWGGVTHYGRPLHLPDEYQAFVILVGAGSFVIELIYIFLALYGFRLVHETNRSAADAWRYIFPVLALAAPVLALKGSLDPWPTYPNIGIYIALGIAAIALIWYAAFRVARPDAVSAAAAYAAADGAPDLPPRGEAIPVSVVERGAPAR
jgi:divalent metal cation (Fe/Co/Zn/Cd) transporter